MHGGTHRGAQRRRRQGSEFIVRPAALRHEARQRAGATRRRGAANRFKLLVVDDNVDAAQSPGLLLGALGGDVEVVYDGAVGARASRARHSLRRLSWISACRSSTASSSRGGFAATSLVREPSLDRRHGLGPGRRPRAVTRRRLRSPPGEAGRRIRPARPPWLAEGRRQRQLGRRLDCSDQRGTRTGFALKSSGCAARRPAWTVTYVTNGFRDPLRISMRCIPGSRSSVWSGGVVPRCSSSM